MVNRPFRRRTACAVLTCLWFVAIPAAAQQADDINALRQEMEELRRRDADTRRRLEELQQRLDRLQAPPPAAAPVAQPAAPPLTPPAQPAHAADALDRAIEALGQPAPGAGSQDLLAAQVGPTRLRLIDLAFDTIATGGTSTATDDQIRQLEGGVHDPQPPRLHVAERRARALRRRRSVLHRPGEHRVHARRSRSRRGVYGHDGAALRPAGEGWLLPDRVRAHQPGPPARLGLGRPAGDRHAPVRARGARLGRARGGVADADPVVLRSHRRRRRTPTRTTTRTASSPTTASAIDPTVNRPVANMGDFSTPRDGNTSSTSASNTGMLFGVSGASRPEQQRQRHRHVDLRCRHAPALAPGRQLPRLALRRLADRGHEARLSSSALHQRRRHGRPGGHPARLRLLFAGALRLPLRLGRRRAVRVRHRERRQRRRPEQRPVPRRPSPRLAAPGVAPDGVLALPTAVQLRQRDRPAGCATRIRSGWPARSSSGRTPPTSTEEERSPCALHPHHVHLSAT